MEQEHFMRRALSLAKLGLGKVKTNPMVGCVIVKNNTIVGEGYHEVYGQAHAEVNALKHLKNKDLSDHEAFVTLEPCSHFGKTPPCADLLISSGIKKVSIAMLDPNPLVAGQGIKKMLGHGMDVKIGLLEEEAMALNKVFIHGIKHKLPFITLKWAECKNGYIAGTKGSEKITGPNTDIISHTFRAQIDAIGVGSKTILTDNPQLDTRLVSNEQKLKISFGTQAYPGYIRINPISIEADLKGLYKNHNVGHLLIEGGAKTLQFFIDNKWYNHIRVIKSNTQQFNAGTAAPTLDIQRLKTEEVISTETDQIKTYAPC